MLEPHCNQSDQTEESSLCASRIELWHAGMMDAARQELHLSPLYLFICAIVCPWVRLCTVSCTRYTYTYHRLRFVSAAC